ncbi:hypothetical protein PMAYCL1PPCAC_29824, partial [Pristionchus mayeri]
MSIWLSIVVNGRVSGDPRDKEGREGSACTLLGQFPEASHLFLTDPLVVDDEVLSDESGDSSIRSDGQDSREGNHSEDDSHHQGEHLAPPVEDIQKIVLVGPLGTWTESLCQDRAPSAYFLGISTLLGRSGHICEANCNNETLCSHTNTQQILKHVKQTKKYDNCV